VKICLQVKILIFRSLENKMRVKNNSLWRLKGKKRIKGDKVKSVMFG
jgi:hypothetical protein